MKQILHYARLFIVGINLAMAPNAQGAEMSSQHLDTTDQIEIVVVPEKTNRAPLKKTATRIIGSGLIVATALILDQIIFQGSVRKKFGYKVLSLGGYSIPNNTISTLGAKKNWYTPEWYDANASLKENWQNYVNFHEERRRQGIKWI